MASICVVRQLYFLRDPACRREVDALLDAGHDVDIVCLRRKGEALRDVYRNARLWRIPIAHRRGSAFSYLFEYASILILAMIIVGVLHLRRRFDLIQVNTPPDTLVFSAIVPRLLGAKVLLQLKEPMPEFFAAKFKADERSWAVRAVAWMEQLSIRFADFAITCTVQMRDAFVARGAPTKKFAVVLPSSSEDDFAAAKARSNGHQKAGEFVLISHGSIEERYGLDTVIRALALLRGELPLLRFDIYGEGSDRARLGELASALGVSDRVRFSKGWVPLEELRQAIADADAGVVAMKRDPFRDLTQCNKMYDFISMRRPAIVSRTTSVDEYFGDDAFMKFVADDPADLARAINALAADPQLQQRLVATASAVNEPYRWPHQREIYLAVVARLTSRSKRRSALQGPRQIAP